MKAISVGLPPFNLLICNKGSLVVPIYEYECGSCGEEHEVIHGMSDGPLRKCPACGRLKLRRKISRSAFHLKGEGWYVTDYGKNGKKDSKQGEQESKSDSKNGSQSGSSGDSSNAAAKETKSESKSGGEKKKSESQKAKAKTSD